MKTTITLHHTFLSSAYELPKEITKKVFKALRNLAKDQLTFGSHLERLSDGDSGLYSLRVDSDYRIILVIDGAMANILYVAKHDGAYRYAHSVSKVALSAPAGLSLTVPRSPGPQSSNKQGLSVLNLTERFVESKYLPLARFLAKHEHQTYIFLLQKLRSF